MKPEARSIYSDLVSRLGQWKRMAFSKSPYQRSLANVFAVFITKHIPRVRELPSSKDFHIAERWKDLQQVTTIKPTRRTVKTLLKFEDLYNELSVDLMTLHSHEVGDDQVPWEWKAVLLLLDERSLSDEQIAKLVGVKVDTLRTKELYKRTKKGLREQGRMERIEKTPHLDKKPKGYRRMKLTDEND